MYTEYHQSFPLEMPDPQWGMYPLLTGPKSLSLISWQAG